jgi:hypothetical protein
MGAFDDVVALEKRAPGDDQEVRQPRVGKHVVQRLGSPHLVEEDASAPGSVWVEPARELPEWILLEQGSHVRRRDPSDESAPEDRPPELVVG